MFLLDPNDPGESGKQEEVIRGPPEAVQVLVTINTFLAENVSNKIRHIQHN